MSRFLAGITAPERSTGRGRRLRTSLARPARAEAALRAAADRLAARRQRDALPGRIATPRLVLRSPIRGDVPDIVRLLDNPNIHAMLSRLPNPYTAADAIAFVEIFSQRSDERPYAITLEGRCIGIVGFSYLPEAPPELGYWLGEAHWGRGYMGEALEALLQAAFATGHYPHIRARALPGNRRSLRVLERAGFTRTGEGLEDGETGRAIVHLEREQPRWM